MALTAPSTTVAPFDSGYIAVGITASATTITISPITKTVNGVNVKQGFDTTAGLAIISQGDYFERISFEGASVDATTKVTTLTSVTRGLSVTSASASFSGGTGRIWRKGANIAVVADASYFQSGAFKNVANTWTATQTFSAPVIVNGTTSYIKLPSMTEAQRNALTASNGMAVYVTDGSNANRIHTYEGGAWGVSSSTTVADGSTTVAGKFEEATVAEQGTATATGSTGARLVVANANLVKTSSGAADENKIAVLDSSGNFATGFLPNIPVTKLNSGTNASSSTFWRGDGAWSSPSSIFGDGSDGTPTWTSGATLNNANEFNYVSATLPVSQTLTVSTANIPLVLKIQSDFTLNGTLNLDYLGGAGGSGKSSQNDGDGGTAGKSRISGFTFSGGGGGGGYAASTSRGGGGGAGANQFSSGGAGSNHAGGSGGGTAGALTLIDSNIINLLTNVFYRGVVCGSGGGGGGRGNAGTSGNGGAGGGSSIIHIGGNLTLGSSSQIKCRGANGGNAVTEGGGGGGGGGGIVIILVNGTITNSGITLSAGGGDGGTGGAQSGSGGYASGGGKIIIFSLSTGTFITS